MSIIRVKKDRNNPYLVMNKTGLNDNRLSLKAKGLLCYLLSKPDNWYINTKDVINNSLDGRASVFSAINELVMYGYMYKHQFRNDNGSFHSYNYLVYEHPTKSLSKKTTTYPQADFRDTANPIPDKRLLLNNKTKKIIRSPLTTLVVKSNNVDVVQEDLCLEEFKEQVILLLYEFGINDYQKLFKLFDIGDIFDYVDWMIPFKSRIKNKMGFLISALNEKWADPESFKRTRQPLE